MMICNQSQGNRELWVNMLLQACKDCVEDIKWGPSTPIGHFYVTQRMLDELRMWFLDDEADSIRRFRPACVVTGMNYRKIRDSMVPLLDAKLKRLNDFIKSYSQIINILSNHFWDRRRKSTNFKKVDLWLRTPNIHIGGIRPMEMVTEGDEEKLLEWIKFQLSENEGNPNEQLECNY